MYKTARLQALMEEWMWMKSFDGGNWEAFEDIDSQFKEEFKRIEKALRDYEEMKKAL